MGKDLKMRCLSKALKVVVFIFMSLLICASLVTKNIVYADPFDARVSAENQEIHRGQTFEVDINISENTGIQTLYLTIKFDHNVFKLINVQQVRTALSELNMENSGSGYDYIDEKTGGFNLFWDGSKPDTSNGTIARLTFESSLTAPIGTYPVDIVVDAENTTKSYNVGADVQAISPEITLIEGAYVVVWHDWNGVPVENTNIQGHPYNELTGGYEYTEEDGLNIETDFPNNPVREEDDMYTYQFAYWEGAVWHGDTPKDTKVIYYIAKYISTPKKYVVWYYVDGYGKDNEPDGKIDEDAEYFTFREVDYGGIIDDKVLPSKTDYTFYGWYTDPNFKNRLITPLMPAKEVKLYGYFKYNIRETDVPVLHLVYRETVTEGEDEIAYVDVNITKNYGLSSLMITLSEYDKENFTFCGFKKGDIFKQMSFFTTNYEDDYYPDNFSFSWNNSQVNSYEIGYLLTLKFKVNKNALPGAYEVIMIGDNNNTTYVVNEETWYSEVEFINTKIPVGQTNYWNVPFEGTKSVVEVESQKYVPYNIELVVSVQTQAAEMIIDSDELIRIASDNLVVHELFEIYFQQNAIRLTQEQYESFFGAENVVVKIKLTELQSKLKNLRIYYVNDEGKLVLYNSTIEDGSLKFLTNHFSHWALVGDSTIGNVETSSIKMLRISLILFGISASALISIAFVRNRKKQSLVTYKKTRKGGNEN